jgi:hypothetical protein
MYLGSKLLRVLATSSSLKWLGLFVFAKQKTHRLPVTDGSLLAE